MKRFYCNLTCLLALVSLCACAPQTVEGYGSFESFFVDGYSELLSLEFVSFNTEESSIIVRYNSELEVNQQGARERWGDTDGHFLHGDAIPYIRVLDHAFDRITIISNADFNDIEAGQDLGDKVMIYTGSALPSIRAGERLDYPSWEEFSESNLCYYLWPVVKSLNELTKEDLSLINADCVTFIFKDNPIQPKHTFTLTFFEGSKQWTLDVHIDFNTYE